ncbi:hypothetical protein SK854_02580 [Lentzea sp. BCCO 10_0061]|uniref:Uncharacterized protein n=1 Tax=Lentzea sokolovensis TaxID=3095429 RepID=A0ABU4UNA5_9PSEU|nr:hypothetical protein [Lentzea sp. BCCO 10_0061]MDX8140978.1 hypothetical protein [Lentzea sp. BCCO 10_0061]
MRAITVQVRAGLGVGRLAAAMDSLVELHPELCRSGFAHHEVADPVAATPAALAEAEAGLDLRTGVLMHVVWLDAGPVHSGRMVLVLHDIVADRLPRVLPWLVRAWKQPALVS